jgi:hypothetical protein
MSTRSLYYWIGVLVISALNLPPLAGQAMNGQRDIRKLSQHFLNPGGDISPWMFAPESNVQELNTTERPGILVIRHAGQGKDVKGILKDAIRIDDYPLPWEFHLGFLQVKSSELPDQISNFAVGLNIAVTFSDPSTWPKDRTQPPPDTHSFQLLVTHIKAPQIKDGPLNYYDGRKEISLLYGRGDLAPEAGDNWNMPYFTTYDREGGPASFLLEYRLKLVSPTNLEVGFYGGLLGYPHPGWRMKGIDVSRFGKITGIWEVGPIMSLDRWIPDTLAPELGIAAPVKPPDASWPYFLDYAAFFGTGPQTIDQMSDDFEVPGFQAKWYHEGAAIVDTYSHPGNLAVTLIPASTDGWAMCPSSIGTADIDLSRIKDFPGYEVEVSFTPPEGEVPWNLFFASFSFSDESGRGIIPGEGWGVVYSPKEKRHRFINRWLGVDPTSPAEEKAKAANTIYFEFEKEIPEAILGHRPLHMMVQVLDSSHVRIGFKGDTREPWYFSKTFDTLKAFGGRIGKFNPLPCLSSQVTWPFLHAPWAKGYGIGNYPQYPTFIIDYVHFRSGLSQ